MSLFEKWTKKEKKKPTSVESLGQLILDFQSENPEYTEACGGCIMLLLDRKGQLQQEQRELDEAACNACVATGTALQARFNPPAK